MLRSLATLKARNRRPWMLLALPAGAAAAARVVGCSSPGTSSGGSSGHAASAAGSVKTANIGGATVLTNSKGFTLYSFAPDHLKMQRLMHHVLAAGEGTGQRWPGRHR